MKLKTKNDYDCLNDTIDHQIRYRGECFDFERATSDTNSVRYRLRSGYGKRGYKVHFSKWKENKRIVLVYVSEKRS